MSDDRPVNLMALRFVKPEPVSISHKATFRPPTTKPPRPVPPPVRWSLTTKDAADLLGVHYQSMYNWARAGKVPCTRIGRAWRFDPDELRIWAAAGGPAGNDAA